MSGQGAAIGAATGATYALATGKDPVKYAMIGGAVGGTGGAMMPGLSAGTAGGTTIAGTGGTLTGAGASTGANTMFANAAGVNAGANATMGASQAAPGIFSNVTAPLTASQPLSSAAGQTAGLEKSYGILDVFNPNIQSSSLNNASLLEKIGSSASNLGEYAKDNPYLQQMAMQSAQNRLQQRNPQVQSPGLLRGNPTQVQAPQYQVGIPQVTLI
jgi:hypothetical protein